MAHNEHPHSHMHHHHGGKDQTIGRLWISIGLNLMITLAEFVGGILSNSLALLSDALHNLNDTASLGISLFARKVSKKDPNAEKTFGYKRAEIVGAFINLITLVLIALFLIKEGVERFFEPQIINGYVMFAVAIVGLIGNFVTALLLYKSSKDNINIKSAFIHILSDGLSSVGVIIGGWLIIEYQLYIVDTILTVIIGIYILWHSYYMLMDTINILMMSTPPDIKIPEVVAELEQVKRVQDIHHVHIWRLDETNTLLEAHVKIDELDLKHIETIKNELKHRLATEFGIEHSTLEFELEECRHELVEDCN